MLRCLQLSATVCNSSTTWYCIMIQLELHELRLFMTRHSLWSACLGHIFEPSAVYIMVFPSSLSSWVKQSRMKELVTLNHMNQLPKVGPLGSRHINLPEAMKHLMWHPICNPTSAISYKIPQNASIQNVTRKKHKRRQHVAVTISNCDWGCLLVFVGLHVWLRCAQPFQNHLG